MRNKWFKVEGSRLKVQGSMSLSSLSLSLSLLLLIGCKSSKTLTATSDAGSLKPNQEITYLRNISDNFQYAKNITSKIKFVAEKNDTQVSLSGSLKMRRDDVIQIQLTAFGLMEVARIELTPDYLMLIDRYHKKYVKVDYRELDFLNANGLNFYSLQALFWNELFCPGQSSITEDKLSLFSVKPTADRLVVSLKDDAKPKTALMKATAFSWLATQDNSLLTSAIVRYTNSAAGASQMQWQYENFKTFSRKLFPLKNIITIAISNMDIKATMTLINPTNDSDWETRTQLSDRYQQVTIEDLLDEII